LPVCCRKESGKGRKSPENAARKILIPMKSTRWEKLLISRLKVRFLHGSLSGFNGLGPHFAVALLHFPAKDSALASSCPVSPTRSAISDPRKSRICWPSPSIVMNRFVAAASCFATWPNGVVATCPSTTERYSHNCFPSSTRGYPASSHSKQYASDKAGGGLVLENAPVETQKS